jgi:hypothetical protein
VNANVSLADGGTFLVDRITDAAVVLVFGTKVVIVRENGAVLEVPRHPVTAAQSDRDHLAARVTAEGKS